MDTSGVAGPMIGSCEKESPALVERASGTHTDEPTAPAGRRRHPAALISSRRRQRRPFSQRRESGGLLARRSCTRTFLRGGGRTLRRWRSPVRSWDRSSPWALRSRALILGGCGAAPGLEVTRLRPEVPPTYRGWPPATFFYCAYKGTREEWGWALPGPPSTPPGRGECDPSRSPGRR